MSYKNTSSFDGATALIGFLLLLALFIVLLSIGTFFVFFGWNLGIVPLVAACGGTVGKISIWVAFFVNLAIGVLRGLLKSS